MYDIPYDEWASYIASMFPENTEAVLEYACGTGNITLPLVGKGYEITAVDISGQMLDIAQKKLLKQARQARFVCADMTEFKLERPVDAVICACDGVNYLTGDAELERFFKNAYSSLKDGGTFLFDISSAYKLREILGDEFYYDDNEQETLFWQNSFNQKTNLVKMDITLFISDEKCYKRYDELHVQRAWEEAEIKQTLANAGFTDICAYDFLTNNAVRDESERIQFAAVKK